MNKKTILLIVILLLCAGVLAFLGIRLNQESVSRQEAATLLDETRVLNTRLQEEKDSLTASLATETEAKDAALAEKLNAMRKAQHDAVIAKDAALVIE